MRRSHTRGAVGAAATLLALSAAGPAAASNRTALRHSAAPAASRAHRVGSVAAGNKIGFQIDLKLPHPQAAAAFTKAVSTPGSAQYRHFLTAKQWEKRFSPSAKSVAKVRSFLAGKGFSVGRTSPDRMEVAATGTARQIETAFDTSLAQYRVSGRDVRLASSNLSVPASLGAVIGGVSGVNQSFAKANHTKKVKVSSTPKTQGGGIPPEAGYRNAQPCGSSYDSTLDTTLPAYGNGYPTDPPWTPCGYTGPQLRSAYGLTSADNGAGATVAVVDAYASPFLESDAQEFAAKNDDPSNQLTDSEFSELTPQSYTETTRCGANGWFGEQSLDVEAVHDMAPGAHILYVGASSCSTLSLNDALRQIVDGGLAQVITDSWGDTGGDLLDNANDRQSTDNILEMAAATGISVLFSSGDDGDEFTTIGQVAADYPASSPYSTAVGGTTLQIGSDGQRLGEYGWSTARSFLCNDTEISLGACTKSQLNDWLPIDLALDGGSGGGTSVNYAQPWYQAGVVPTSLSEVNGTSTPMRVEPDISMEADPGTGMLMGQTQVFPDGTYYDQYRIGGTSVASPLFAGLLARAIETDGGQGFGLVNPALYALSGNTTAIDDIGPAGNQIQSRADYANSVDASQGYLYSTRIIDYEGPEQFCPKAPKKAACLTRNVALNAVAGYDNMTGLGSPGAGLVSKLAGK